MANYKDYGWEDGATDAHSYLYPALLKILSKYKGKRILDIGCGNGAIACRLLDHGFDVHGIDASESGIRIANQKYPDRFYVQDISDQHLPFAISHLKFDVIISTEVIEHIYAPRTYMNFIKNNLSPGGILIISTPYHGYLKNLVLALTNKLDNHFTALWDGGHIKFWSVKTLSTLLNEFEFKIIDYKGCGRMPYLWKSMFFVATH